MLQPSQVDSYVSMHCGWADDHFLEGFIPGFASGIPLATNLDYVDPLPPD